MTAPILIMAGGTGGHVFPALAVARILRYREEQVVWLGTRRGIEAELVPAADFELECIRVGGLRRKGVLGWLLAPARLAVAIVDAWRVLRRVKPRVVLGMGGFASGPGGLVAGLMKCPLVIHEQNSIAGLTNRLLAGMAREVLTAFPGSFSSRVKTREVGNPVRDEITQLPEPAVRWSERSGPVRLLVLGGSQGALVLNEMVAEAVALLAADERPAIRHQAGRATLEGARDAYEFARIPAEVDAFIDDMAAAYAWADLVLCRAGALTVAELSSAGVGAILVPYPSAVDDHQTKNGELLVNADAAVLLQQGDLTPAYLAAELRTWTRSRALCLQRAERARSLAQPRAAEVVADVLLSHALEEVMA